MNQNQIEIKPEIRDINEELGREFRCTTQYYQWSSLFPFMLLTDGAYHVAEAFDAHWFIDLIGSYQDEPKVKQEYFQFWTLEACNGKGFAKLEHDTNHEILRQRLDYTTFPDARVRLYAVRTQVNGRFALIVCLPSEN